jgi:hypothetical protein
VEVQNAAAVTNILGLVARMGTVDDSDDPMNMN